jgi:orotidine-5'-phosphate decarboxylase
MFTAAQRLIVAADFRPDGSKNQCAGWVRSKVLRMADALYGLEVHLKVNSALRALGYPIIKEIHDRELKVFADLKLNDISETLGTDGALLREFNPELVTVMSNCGIPAMRSLKEKLPGTEVLGVGILTSLGDGECRELYARPTKAASVKLATWAVLAGVDGVVSSAIEAEKLRKVLPEHMTVNTPAIRPWWSLVASDDQNKNRVTTPKQAIQAGAARIIVGRPILQADNPREAVLRTLEEIEEADSGS